MQEILDAPPGADCFLAEQQEIGESHDEPIQDSSVSVESSGDVGSESGCPNAEFLRHQLRIALRRARAGAGMTQKAAAERLDWSVSKTVRIEQGVVPVSTGDALQQRRLVELTGYIREVWGWVQVPFRRAGRPSGGSKDKQHPSLARRRGTPAGGCGRSNRRHWQRTSDLVHHRSAPTVRSQRSGCPDSQPAKYPLFQPRCHSPRLSSSREVARLGPRPTTNSKTGSLSRPMD